MEWDAVLTSFVVSLVGSVPAWLILRVNRAQLREMRTLRGLEELEEARAGRMEKE